MVVLNEQAIMILSKDAACLLRPTGLTTGANHWLQSNWHIAVLCFQSFEEQRCLPTLSSNGYTAMELA